MTDAKIAIVDPTFLEYGGHHMTCLETLQKALQPHQAVFYIHRHSSSDVSNILDDVRFEFATEQHRLSNQRVKRQMKPVRWTISQTVRRLGGKPADRLNGKHYVRELERLFDAYGPSDHLISPTTRADMLGSLITVASSRKTETLPHVHLRFLEYAPESDSALATANYERLAELSAENPHIHIYTETQTLRRHFEDRFGIKGIGSAILQPGPTVPAVERKAMSDKIRIGYLGGNLRRNKGFERIPAIVGLTMQKVAGTALENKIEFVIQLAHDENSIALRKELSELPGIAQGQLRFVEGDHDLEAFTALLASCDVMLFPYSQAREQVLAGSGILIDAVIHGVPLVSAPISTLSEFVEEETGKIASSDQEFADAIVEIASDIGTYGANAARRSLEFSEAWRTNDLVTNVRRSLQDADA
ncbi:glycosyltransferase [Hoeflea prorocentri]|uniref:Glycosyltransferase n=1 Tax=Hoeflea prorocentri TaxID=1922333 RepID=A0A9X3ZID5_9HYPH|nr:glycosyltransferase [Hoeflea prorocentri]MCY6382812.1 glycosyltransferase [Hoeflea prorocentri]MDA5400612.1 glycosyltransferase [Hoeflea prorocentri]